jgi:hypothetical protein
LTSIRLASWGKRQSKYGNRRVKTAAGVSFDSQSEAKRWAELKLLERAGEIRELTLHPRYDLSVNGIHICDMIPDYSYECLVEGSDGRHRFFQTWMKVCEDRKGGTATQTDVFKLKRKLLKAIHNIDILITGKKT